MVSMRSGKFIDRKNKSVSTSGDKITAVRWGQIFCSVVKLKWSIYKLISRQLPNILKRLQKTASFSNEVGLVDELITSGDRKSFQPNCKVERWMRILSQMHARTVHFQPSTQRPMRDLANAEKLREIEFSCRRELVGLSTKKSEHIDNIIEIHYRLRRPYKVQNEPNLIGTSVCGSRSQNYRT